MKDTITKLMKRCGLGEVTAEITPVSGGLMHRMYKVRTDSGIYAVKRLNPEIMKRPTARENYAAAEALEARLEEARVPMVAALTLKGRKMQELLPECGIELIEIPRLEAISASRVRALIRAGKPELTKDLVPETTYAAILRYVSRNA